MSGNHFLVIILKLKLIVNKYLLKWTKVHSNPPLSYQGNLQRYMEKHKQKTDTKAFSLVCHHEN